MSELSDIFGVPLKVGDKIAAGMAFGRSSVLRIGEVLNITETETYYGSRKKWSIRVKWTHNGSTTPRGVKESTILYEELYNYAKFVILPPEFVDQFPADIEET